jgi:chromosome segregation ATPase
VKKATRELASSLAGCDSAIARIDYVQKRYAALVGEMKKLEREHRAAKRKADLMQKERDGAKTELTKMTSVKDKLEKLSRETTNENRKLRVGCSANGASDRAHTPQAQVQQCEDKDAKVRNELMSRLNDMSSGVEQAIHTREQVRSQSATIESDELYANP